MARDRPLSGTGRLLYSFAARPDSSVSSCMNKKPLSFPIHWPGHPKRLRGQVIRLTKPRNNPGHTQMQRAIRALNTTVLLTLLAVSGCHLYGPAPGNGAKAEYFYARAEPIIQALEAYRHSTGSYPEKLEALRPDYIRDIDWPAHMYRRTQGEYELSFSYEGPGINSCVYRPAENWDCSGLI